MMKTVINGGIVALLISILGLIGGISTMVYFPKDRGAKLEEKCDNLEKKHIEIMIALSNIQGDIKEIRKEIRK